MQNFTAALGVGCDYCHVQTPGTPPDFASDDKEEKDLARAMMKITTDLNARLPTDFGKPANELTRVGCITCHRGVPEPKQLAEILAKTSAEKGFPAASAQYDDLKKKYYGAQAYDFSETGLIATATPLIQMRTDEAIQFLQMNLKLFPQSARSYVSLATGAAGEERQPGRDCEPREGARDRPEERAGDAHAGGAEEVAAARFRISTRTGAAFRQAAPICGRHALPISSSQPSSSIT